MIRTINLIIFFLIVHIILLLFLSYPTGYSYADTVGTYDPNVLSMRAMARDSIYFINKETDWIQKGGLELIIGGPTRFQEEFRTFWGHISLRLVGSGQTDEDDFVLDISPLEVTPGSMLQFFYKEVSDGYHAEFTFRKFGYLLKQYLKQSLNRGFTRSIIPSTSEQRQSLLEVVMELNQDQQKHIPYYFWNKNCASSSLWLLQRSGFLVLPWQDPLLPQKTDEHLRRSHLTPWPIIKGSLNNKTAPEAFYQLTALPREYLSYNEIRHHFSLKDLKRTKILHTTLLEDDNGREEQITKYCAHMQSAQCLYFDQASQMIEEAASVKSFLTGDAVGKINF